MNVFQSQMCELRSQLQKGIIQPAYRGLIDYILGLRNYFQKNYPKYSLPGGIYTGYLDMTYFSIVTEPLKRYNLKIAVVFVYSSFRFEIWLSGVNRNVQAEFRERIVASGWKNYPLADPVVNRDAIIERILVEDPDFGNLNDLTARIAQGVSDFIAEMEELADHMA